MLKRLTAACLLSFAGLGAAAQLPDSADMSAGGEFRRRIDRHTSTKAYRMLFVGTPLIVGGVVMQAYDSDFRRLRNGYSRSFRHDYDDWLQYAPAGAMVALKACGVRGYTVATVTGVTRQLNNRHWMSDIMVGAGIGILATELGYFLADLIFKEKGLNVTETYSVYDRCRRPSFLGFSLGFSTVPGSYTPYPGMHMQFLSGPAVSVQGAWFATPYWGFGGRMSCTNLRVKVNGVAQNDNLECASMYAGPYFSHPFSMRWLVGAKLLGGCEIYKPCRTDFRRLERRAGFSFGTGLSTTYLATQNLGVRFSTDYDVAPPVVRSSRERLHKLTFSMEVCAVF